MRARWRHSRTVLKEGLQAALRADPQVLEKCAPKTGYGLIARGLVLEAGKCKATPLKILMSLIGRSGEDGGDEDGGDEEEAEAGCRDWSADGVWETTAEAESENEPPEEGEGAPDCAKPELRFAEGRAKKELKRRLTRLVEAGEHEHVARVVDALRSSAYSAPEPVPTG